MGAHALLSASGSSRWLNCTPSARLEEDFIESTSSVFAEEGTLAHGFGELALRKFAKEITVRKYNAQVKKLKLHELYSPEMDTEVEKYVNFVLEQFAVAKKQTPDAVLLIEERVDLGEYIEKGFGTCDANIIADNVLDITDLKYGKGVKVDAVDNPQLKLYGLGALAAYDMMYDIETVKLNVFQPRLDHISTWEISADELIDWGYYVVKPKALQAYKGEGLQHAGSWCKWCKAKARCATLASQNLKVAKHEFKNPHLLTDPQILEVYKQMPVISDWIKAVGDYLLKEALTGKKWAGYKLVEGRSVRKWKDEEKVKEVLNLYEDVQILNVKLKGIGDITTLVGKADFNGLLGEYIVKPPGKPTLVGNSDKRPAMGIEQAKEDFLK